MESAAGNLFRSAPPPIARTPQAASSLFAELRERGRPWGAVWLRRVFGVRRLAIALSAFFSINLAMAFTIPPVQRWWSQVVRAQATQSSRASQSSQAFAKRAPSVPTAAAPAPTATLTPPPTIDLPPGLELPAAGVPPVEAAALSRPRRHVYTSIASREPVAELPHPAPIAASPRASQSLAGESDLLARALAALGEGHPSQALAAIAIYQQQFPHGSLAYEATLAEVKAELASGQPGRALSALEKATAMPGFELLPRSNELTLMRAELLARAQSCGEALPIFDRLAGSPDALDPPLVERALYGRAGCLASQGDREGSRTTLKDYLDRFPGGRFAAAARTALGMQE